jgi:hypothetical protein
MPFHAASAAVATRLSPSPVAVPQIHDARVLLPRATCGVWRVRSLASKTKTYRPDRPLD